MRETTAHHLLSARHGTERVTIGLDAPEVLRSLSDARALTCPGCKATVVLHAGSVRAHHFAHLAGALCTLPQTEPETEEHRAGKLLLARWLRERLPDAEVIVEAYLPETGQRADVLAILPHAKSASTSMSGRESNARAKKSVGKPRRIALEYQCANLSAREWRRRHSLYQSAGIDDLWLLGGSRLIREQSSKTGSSTTPINSIRTSSAPSISADNFIDDKRSTCALRTTDLERALLWDGAPLLFADASGATLPIGTLVRFRPDPHVQAMRPTGRLSTRPLLSLAFPYNLLDWQTAAHLEPQSSTVPSAEQNGNGSAGAAIASDRWLWEWLAVRHRVTPDTLSPFFGLEIAGTEAFGCEARVWQAAVYYRFVHLRVGDGWWLGEVETWARAYLPITHPVRLPLLQKALGAYQDALAAAGFLSLPRGYQRGNARITADLMTLPAPPDAAETLRLMRYRRTLLRETPKLR